MGYLRGVVHGMVLGAAAALLYAPKEGRQLRRDLGSRLDRVRGQMQPVLEQAQGVVDTARPRVKDTINRAQEEITRRSRQLPFVGNEGSSNPSI